MSVRERRAEGKKKGHRIAGNPVAADPVRFRERENARRTTTTTVHWNFNEIFASPPLADQRRRWLARKEGRGKKRERERESSLFSKGNHSENNSRGFDSMG